MLSAFCKQVELQFHVLLSTGYFIWEHFFEFLFSTPTLSAGGIHLNTSFTHTLLFQKTVT